jgi:uncharacterized protein with FMN-binding domain
MTTKANSPSDVHQKAKGKRKSILKGCLIALMIIVVLLAVGGGIGWSLLTKEHRDAASLPLNAVDFDKLSDGKYHGVYAGGVYKWRFNECDVTVTNNKVTDINLSVSNDPAKENMNAEELYDRVIKAQSLQVDTLSSSTLTSKAYLQCVENALIQAQHE